MILVSDSDDSIDTAIKRERKHRRGNNKWILFSRSAIPVMPAPVLSVPDKHDFEANVLDVIANEESEGSDESKACPCSDEEDKKKMGMKEAEHAREVTDGFSAHAVIAFVIIEFNTP